EALPEVPFLRVAGQVPGLRQNDGKAQLAKPLHTLRPLEDRKRSNNALHLKLDLVASLDAWFDGNADSGKVVCQHGINAGIPFRLLLSRQRGGDDTLSAGIQLLPGSLVLVVPPSEGAADERL